MVSLVKVIFILSKIFELAIVFLAGKGMQSESRKGSYWGWAFLAIVAFACVEGLRFGRMIDWNVYYFRYINIGTYFFSEEYEPLFKVFCYVFYNIGCPYWFFIFCQCAFYFFCVTLFVKRFRKHASFILLIAVIVSCNIEQFIRWYLAVSFVILSMHFLLDNKKPQTIIFFLCAFFCHYGTCLFAPLILFRNKLNALPVSQYVLLGGYVCTAFILSLADLAFLGEITNYLSLAGVGDDKYGHYLSKTQTIMMGDGRLGYFSVSMLHNIKRFLAFAPIILFGKKEMESYTYGNYLYYLAALGIIITPLFAVVELFDRYANFFNFFSCVVGGFVFYRMWHVKKNRIDWKFFFCMLGFICLLYTPIANAISRNFDESMLFIWDANGRNVMPLIMRW